MLGLRLPVSAALLLLACGWHASGLPDPVAGPTEEEDGVCALQVQLQLNGPSPKPSATPAALEAARAPTPQPTPAPPKGFPNFDDPIAAEPPLPHPKASGGVACGTVAAIVGAEIDGWDQLVVGQYEPPLSCTGTWHQVVVELSGAVAGTQFDRYGAVWFRGVEILRTTTPEPSPEGIRWKVVKDLSDYRELFSASGNVTLMIPNVVDDTYTGVFNVSVTFSFFAGPAQEAAKTIIPLRNLSMAANPFDEISVSSTAGQENIVRLPQDVVGARLDLFASAHSCEEFWYTNSLSDNPSDCGGGAYRELRVYVDGTLAGVQHPFPVLYTGGMNPVLWRPLTGIVSFDIPPYHFDLDPFLGWLNDGKEHNITVVATDNVNGVWYLNGVLALTRDPGGVIGGSVEVLYDAPSQVDQSNDETRFELVQKMSASSRFHVRGTLELASGEKVAHELVSQLTAWSSARFTNTDLGIVGRWRSVVTSLQNGENTTIVSDFPLNLTESIVEDNTSTYYDTCIQYARNVESGHQGYAVSISNAMEGCALYGGDIEQGQTKESFTVRAGPVIGGVGAQLPQTSSACYQRELRAGDGIITLDRSQNTCAWPHGVYVCGSDFCGSFLAEPLAGAAAAAEMLALGDGDSAVGGAAAPTVAARKGDGGPPGPCRLPRRGLRYGRGTASWGAERALVSR